MNGLPWGQPFFVLREGSKVGAANREQLEQEVKKAAQGGRLSCAQAFAIADKLGVEPKTVGQAANDLKIKIAGCRLGCF